MRTFLDGTVRQGSRHTTRLMGGNAMRGMRALLAGLFILAAMLQTTPPAQAAQPTGKKVYVLPIREDIDAPLVYLVRRGVKEAMTAKADLLVVDMDTNGGRVDVTQEIIEILSQFKGKTVTYVNRKAFSAGAFISVSTQQIFMAPQSVIGAAAPIMLSPGGTGVEKMPETFEVKMTSGLSALVRTSAEKNGYNKAVVQKMIDKSSELKMDGEVINEKGQILTLTNLEAEKEYGTPPKSLLSSGTFETLDAMLAKIGYADASRVDIKPTGMEKLGLWINAISPILLMIGMVGIYIEFKTPGFGFPGIVAIIAFVIYFLGGYVAGLSGMEWLLVFLLGVALVAVELFALPGYVAPGVIGVMLMLAAVIMALADVYPAPSLPEGGAMPAFPTMLGLRDSLQNFTLSLAGALAAVFVLSRFLPKTSVYRALVSEAASGVVALAEQQRAQTSRVGQVGAAITDLRPGGKGRFGNDILDVITQGELISKGRAIRIMGYTGSDAIVEPVE